VDLGVINKERMRCVQFEAPTGAGVSYAAYLPLNHIPEPLAYNQHWIHHASSLKFPVDVSLRFEIIDPDRAEKDLDRPIFAAEAQEEEDRDAGVRADDITALQQHGLRQVKQSVRMNREPLTYWQAVFCVYDTDKDELLSKVARLIKHYKDIQFKLECPRNDQRELFYQSFPGSEILVEDWMHRTNVQYLAAAMPWLTSTVGDREDTQGTYQGHTIVRDANGNAQKGVPVFHDLHNVVDTEGKAPTEVVTGNPGSGKSVSRGLKIAHEDGLRGITQFIWDPKGDFLPLKLFASRLLLDPNKVKLVDLYKAGNSVSLDAYAIAEVNPDQGIDQRADNALDVLTLLCRDFVNDPQYRLDYKDMLGGAVRYVMTKERTDGVQPSMKGTLDVLRQWALGDYTGVDLPASKREDWKDHARRLVQHLERVEDSTLGRLLFRDPSTAGAMRISEGDMVIFVALNMVTTDPGQEPSNTSLVADVISGLMTDYIRSLLYILPDEVAKSAVFDEWHVIKRTSRAEALLDWLRRMGRSKRCSVRQMSQSAKDFSKGSLSTVWCGWCQDDDEAEASCNLLGIEASATNKALLKNQGKGQFLHRDVFGRVAQVQVDIWDDNLLRMFNTEATAKAEILRQLSSEGLVSAHELASTA
ncbi:MAG: ATP-binding protein, partial [Microlunatus sp.]|nr:ATP-binding protein [Microlunatus sp.]